MTTTSATERTYGDAFRGNAAECYERFFIPAIGGPLARDLVAHAALRPGERVLDVACGTGIVARLAAERVAPGGSVAGLDVTAGMLAMARAISARAGASIQWYESSAEAMPLPEGAFDVVFSQLGLQFVPDKPAAVSEIRRVLAPGGRAYVTVPAPTSFFDVLDEAFERRGVPAAAVFVRAVFSLHDPNELERLFRDARFTDVEIRSDIKRLHLPSSRDFLWQYVQSTPMSAALAQLEPDARDALERDVTAAWDKWGDGGGMTYLQPILIAAGHR